MKNKKIIAHRGASDYEVENTLESFQRAKNLGADMVEFDLRKTSDNVLIAYHDAKIMGKSIKETSYEILNQLSARQGFHIPKVKEIIGACGKDFGYDIDVKDPEAAIEAAELMKSLGVKKTIITSTYLNALKQIKRAYPKIGTGYIIAKEGPKYFGRFVKLRFFPKNAVEIVHKEGFDYLVPDYRFIGKELLQESAKRGIKLLPWTLNSTNLIKKFLREESVYGIITDRPDLAVSLN